MFAIFVMLVCSFNCFAYFFCLENQFFQFSLALKALVLLFASLNLSSSFKSTLL